MNGCIDVMINTTVYLQAIQSIASSIPVNNCKVLVTGATGLIGSCLVDVFIEANRTFGKQITFYAVARNKKNLFDKFGSAENVHCIPQDVVEPITIDGLDYIIHAASNADPQKYALFPAETILTNILGAKSVLDYCKTHKTRVLLTSSFEVYGKLEQDFYSENEYGLIDLNFIRSCYPESKRTAEMLFKSYFDEYNVNCVIARLSSIYGPTMQLDDSKAHAQFLRNAILGKEIVLKSKGLQRRTYCYVMDAVSGLLFVLFYGKKGEAYNVANDKSVATIAELASIIAELVGTKVIYTIPDDLEKKGYSIPQNCILRVSKIKELGWSGKYDLITGLSETIAIMRTMIKN